MMIANLLLAATSISGPSTPIGFIDDYDLALSRAKAEEKIVVADFSGSDWCFWCQRLDQEIFSQEAFARVATNKYVLLMIDRPRDKSRLSEKAKVQNPQLAKKYKVSSYPTVLLLDGEGKIVGETGFVGGGPENYLKHLDEKVAAIPVYLEHVKPLIKRINAWNNRFSEQMTLAMRRAQPKTKEESLAVRRATIPGLLAELAAIIEEERARERPAAATDECAKLLSEAENLLTNLSQQALGQ